MTPHSYRVAKVGGSLFNRPDLRERLIKWRAGQPPAATVLVAGGGELADAVRRFDSLHALDAAAAHWLAIAAMGVSARGLVAIMPGAALCGTITEIEAATGTGAPAGWAVVDPEPFLRRDESSHPRDALPRGWHVTSDSIAARIATVLGARELVLFKSADPPPGTTRRDAAESGCVDPYFSIAARSVPVVRFVNLRGEAFTQSFLE
jgi:aspartokinase-like uncharacterized kinase